jgi:hypothetical protein
MEPFLFPGVFVNRCHKHFNFVNERKKEKSHEV